MILADALPPAYPTAGTFLQNWAFEPLVMIPIIVIGVLYLVGYRRVRRQPGPRFPAYRAWSFIASLVVLVIAVDGPLDSYSDIDLAVHMFQHIVLIGAVGPLAVIGAPVTVALRAATPRGRSRFVAPVLRSKVAYILTRPLFAGLYFVADLVGTHFTPLYNMSLSNEHIHDCEHLSYVVAGLVMSQVLLGVESFRRKPGYGERLLLVLMTMPVMTGIGMVFILANHPLYPYYVALPAPWGGVSQSLAEQGLAGAIMAVPMGFLSFFAFIYAAAQWLRADEARQLRTEAIEDAREREARQRHLEALEDARQRTGS